MMYTGFHLIHAKCSVFNNIRLPLLIVIICKDMQVFLTSDIAVWYDQDTGGNTEPVWKQWKDKAFRKI